jgi:hypothetical protein
MVDESFLEYYKQYKDLLDSCIPKDVLNRLLKKAETEPVRGDAWEPTEKAPWD